MLISDKDADLLKEHLISYFREWYSSWHRYAEEDEEVPPTIIELAEFVENHFNLKWDGMGNFNQC